MEHTGQVVLITGASSGMGKATAKALIQKGYTVYAAARRIEEMEDLRKRGGFLIEMDVTKEEDLVAAVEHIQQEHGGVDILINNAGFGLYGPVEELPLERARYQFEVNLFGLARLTQLVLPDMREKRAGKIINISSMGGKIYTPMGAWYHASKHALEGWSDCLRFELRQFDIDVIIIEPGLIATEFNEVMTSTIPQESWEGPYRQIVEGLAENANEENVRSYSPPAEIAKVILKAINTDRPKTRYVAGRMARPLILMRRLLGDKIFDRLLAIVMG